MALIEINPDVRLLVKELRRIAVALEMHLLLAYRYRTEAVPSKKGLAEDEETRDGQLGDVQYSTDEETLKREVEAARREIEESDEAGLVK